MIKSNKKIAVVIINYNGEKYLKKFLPSVVNFSDKKSHQVFLEPEGLNTSTVYPNGISTSLPESVQNAYVRTIKGLENVRILQPGYALSLIHI